MLEVWKFVKLAISANFLHAEMRVHFTFQKSVGPCLVWLTLSDCLHFILPQPPPSPGLSQLF